MKERHVFKWMSHCTRLALSQLQNAEQLSSWALLAPHTSLLPAPPQHTIISRYRLCQLRQHPDKATLAGTSLKGGGTLGSSLRLLAELSADVERLVADQDVRGRHVNLESLPSILEQRLQSNMSAVSWEAKHDSFIRRVNTHGQHLSSTCASLRG